MSLSLFLLVIPPPKIEPFIQGTSLEITWKQFGTVFTNYVIHANNSLGTGVGDYKQIVNAADERAVIGPLRGNTWYTVTMQVALDSDSDQVIAQSDPYFIIVHGSTGKERNLCLIQFLGPVHTYPDIFENASFFIRTKKALRPHEENFRNYTNENADMFTIRKQTNICPRVIPKDPSACSHKK